MKRYVEGENRSQSTLFSESLDDYIAEDNPVRVVDVFVDELDLKELGFAGALEGERAAAAARILFLCAAGMMMAIAVAGLMGPKWVFEEARHEVSETKILQF